TVRIVEPCGLLHYLARWHLVAWCRTAVGYRDFRTDRMTAVSMVGETFAPRQDFSLAHYIQTMPTPELRARVHFTPLAADRAKREWWLGVLDEEPAADGIVLTLAAVEWEGLARWLLSFALEVTVLTPASLRKLLVTTAKTAVEHHSGKPGRKKVS
ncbi:MAG TPA: WYL domain-containing protein, partial [Chthoniobacteraceae bacterium]|nr:WYL domain-containing protein [Chthoniobacteraceae bacterium]